MATTRVFFATALFATLATLVVADEPEPAARPLYSEGHDGPYWEDVVLPDTNPDGVNLGAVLQALAIKNAFPDDCIVAGDNGEVEVSALGPYPNWAKITHGPSTFNDGKLLQFYSNNTLWPDLMNDILATATWATYEDTGASSGNFWNTHKLKTMGVADAFHAITRVEANSVPNEQKHMMNSGGELIWKDYADNGSEWPMVFETGGETTTLKKNYAYAVTNAGDQRVTLLDPAGEPGEGHARATKWEIMRIAADVVTVHIIGEFGG